MEKKAAKKRRDKLSDLPITFDIPFFVIMCLIITELIIALPGFTGRKPWVCDKLGKTLSTSALAATTADQSIMLSRQYILIYLRNANIIYY